MCEQIPNKLRNFLSSFCLDIFSRKMGEDDQNPNIFRNLILFNICFKSSFKDFKMLEGGGGGGQGHFNFL